MSTALLVAVAAAIVGWSDITVSPSRSGSITAPWQRSLQALDAPSERTQETLRRYDLDRDYRRNAESALLRLERTARERPELELVIAISELSWLEAKRLERRRKPEALDYYLDAVAYAFDYLFDPELAQGRQVSDPRFQLAMHLYNGGIDRIVRIAQSRGKIEPGATIELKDGDRELRMQVNLDQTPWKASDIQELLLCSDFEVTGLPTKSYLDGLGVPLIAVRRADPAASPDPGSLDRFFPPEMAFPLTAFLRPNSRLRDPNADVKQVRDCTLYLIDPVERRSVVQGDFALAIEADLTTPLAYMWSRTDLSKYRWKGLLRPGEAKERTGLMLLRPYQPDRIPVVMVHGLISSPLAWIPMINELLRDPNIQKRYQFFLYVYPTGVPVPIAASYLRNALLDAQQTFDPAGTGAAFGRMVLLGHSMGGLLSHAMSVSDGNQFWSLYSDWRFQDLIGSKPVLDELRQYNFFEPLPFVQRVVFLATPHRGSEFARRPIGRLTSSLISEPDHYSQLVAQLMRDNADAFDSKQFRRMPTSIDTLEVDSDVLMALLRMKPAPWVKYHSIVGSRSGGPLARATDGVVPYNSAHFDLAVSERVVRSDHSVQKDPIAIQEVRRILMEHLSPPGVGAPDPAVVPTQAGVPMPGGAVAAPVVAPMIPVPAAVPAMP